MSNASHTKKRKANDGRATAPDGAHDVNTAGNTNDGGFPHISERRGGASGPSRAENNTSQLDRMEQIMMRMEEKLATVSCLESRCEQLEAKCSSLETILESTSQSTKEHIDSILESTKEHIDKTFKYHEMLIRNQNWEYSAPVYTLNELALADYDDDETNYIYDTSQMLKRNTEALRRGDFPEKNRDIAETGDEGPGICLHIEAGFPYDDCTYDELSPHWREFAAALKHFKPAFDILPDDCNTCISFGNVKLNQELTQLVKDALMNMPFKIFSFHTSYNFHGDMSAIAAMMGSNTYLQKLDIYQIEGMDRDDITKLCSAIHRHPSLKDVIITACFSDRLGNKMLRSLLRTDELKLERLSMPGNNMLGIRTGFNVCTRLADFLAANPRLKELDLQNNRLDDSDAVLIANALRSNTTLRTLYISENDRVGAVGDAVLSLALCDVSSLNSVADSNHSCSIETNNFSGNDDEDREINRAEKIYGLLSSRNKTMSNVQDFGDIDVKLLPNVLEAVQKYSNRLIDGDEDIVKELSIVYEIMRCWDKVSSLYLR
eukprot:scaffold10274_cov88-Skeletonema_dohrnii-CCMP3373.AAC.2